ncbi:MAG: secondary thiamine-phosphate synthase enzyme YjbQ [Calditrichaceae bacterium]
MNIISIRTENRTGFIDITGKIRQIIQENNMKSGIVSIFIPHTTAAVTINENADPDVQRDMLYEINKIVPFDDGYHHGEGNSAAHIKSSMFGASETIIVENGQLQLGTWQGIYFCEFDGPRNRKIWVKLIKSE